MSRFTFHYKRGLYLPKILNAANKVSIEPWVPSGKIVVCEIVESSLVVKSKSRHLKLKVVYMSITSGVL